MKNEGVPSDEDVKSDQSRGVINLSLPLFPSLFQHGSYEDIHREGGGSVLRKRQGCDDGDGDEDLVRPGRRSRSL